MSDNKLDSLKKTKLDLQQANHGNKVQIDR